MVQWEEASGEQLSMSTHAPVSRPISLIIYQAVLERIFLWSVNSFLIWKNRHCFYINGEKTCKGSKVFHKFKKYIMMISREHRTYHYHEAILYTFTVRKDPKNKKNEVETGSLIKTILGYKAVLLSSPNKFKISLPNQWQRRNVNWSLRDSLTDDFCFMSTMMIICLPLIISITEQVTVYQIGILDPNFNIVYDNVFILI